MAELGLRPEEGGKNFNFKKNKDTLYMSGPEDASMWAEKLKDVTGQEPLRLRAPVKSQQVPGASSAVRTRTEPVPPEMIQYQNPQGAWESVKKLLKKDNPAGPGVNEKQMKLLAAMLGLSGVQSLRE